jgi:DnaJ-class molecular chaperone
MVQIEIEIPTRFDEEQAALWYHLAKIRGEEVAEPSHSVMARLRSVFR